jgi:RNA polymerase-binding transcription factor DksA
MTKDIQSYKSLLEEEKIRLESSLADVGKKNPSNPEDWQGKAENIDEERADPTDTADNIEEYESNTAIVAELETRLEYIEDALERIENGSYGMCRICGGEIEDDRLTANPAAETCKAHVSE